jgi:transposase InsO family protein
MSDDNAEPDTPVAGAAGAALKASFRAIFNLKMYKIVNDAGQIEGGKYPVQPQKAMQMTQARWDHTVECLEKWGSKEAPNKEFRKAAANHTGFNIQKNFHLKPYTSVDGSEVMTLMNTKTGKRIVPQMEVFDAIYDNHYDSNGHMKLATMWVAMNQHFHNVSEREVKQFLALCPVCSKENPQIPKTKGAKKPILSTQFRDRFQIDLIDYGKHPMKDVYGVLMRWLIVVKDHCTGLIYLRAIPRKRPKFVAFELNHIFGLIGYPAIFHTDNGKEFTAQVIVDMVKAMNRGIMTVTGRPRKPQDQGSVENVNKLVKRTLLNLEDAERQDGKDPNWTRLLGNVMSAVNKQCGKGKNEVSAYEAVFGTKYDPDIPVPREELRKCNTIEQRMLLMPSPRLDAVARQLCKFSDDKPDDDDSSTDVLPKKALFDRKQDEEEYWETSSSESEDGTVASMEETPKKKRRRNGVAKAISKSEVKKIKSEVKKAPVKAGIKSEVKKAPSLMDWKTSTTKIFRQLSIAQAFERGKGRLKIWEGDEYKFVYPSLKCEQCCFVGYHLLTVGDEQYFRDCVDTDRWYETEFIASFGALIAHEMHDARIQLIHCQLPKGNVLEAVCSALENSVLTIVSILHGSGHFAVLEATIKTKHISIFDGLSYPLTTWKYHVENVLKRSKLISLDSRPIFKEHSGALILTVGPDNWTIEKAVYLSQGDGFNCGPIACLKLMEVFGAAFIGTHTGVSYRQVVIDKYREMLGHSDERIAVRVSNVVISIDDEGGSDSDDADICIICFGPVKNGQRIQTMVCCQTKLHLECNEMWNEFNSRCVICRPSIKENGVASEGATNDDDIDPMPPTPQTTRQDDSDPLPPTPQTTRQDDSEPLPPTPQTTRQDDSDPLPPTHQTTRQDDDESDDDYQTGLPLSAKQARELYGDSVHIERTSSEEEEDEDNAAKEEEDNAGNMEEEDNTAEKEDQKASKATHEKEEEDNAGNMEEEDNTAEKEDQKASKATHEKVDEDNAGNMEEEDNTAETPDRESESGYVPDIRNATRVAAILKRNERQKVQAEKMKSMYGKHLAKVAVGCIVVLKNDFREVSNPRGILGIVFAVAESDAGGIQVATEHGVIVTGNSKKVFYIPADRYFIKSDNLTIEPKLDMIRSRVKNGTFDRANESCVTMQKAHSLLYGNVEGGKRKCACKKECGPRCGCVQAKTSCNSSCKCFGQCCNS